MKKKVIVSSVILSLFVVYNLIWYFGSYKMYYNYKEEIPEIENTGVYIYEDNEEYQYSVKLPGYLCWDGNLAIAEKNVNHALIIWLTPWGKEINAGLIVSHGSQQKQVELMDSRTSLDKKNQDFVDDNLSIISILFTKANDKWKLDLK